MGKLTFDLNPEMVGLAARLSADLTVENDLLITDKPMVAKRSAIPTVFIADHLSGVVHVMYPRHVQAVLRPSDVKGPQLLAVADGCLVYSKLRARDLSLDRVVWEITRRRAHGQHVAQVGSAVGYSERQVIRICDDIRNDAGVGGGFTWQTLAPVFPCPDPG